ncbi:MAG: glutamine synthetase, partial [Bacteroidota bacterium]
MSKIVDSGFGFCNVVFGWDAGDVPYENGQLSGWHTGYPDALARLDFQTFRNIPWEDGLPFVLGDFRDDKAGFAEACPRTLLSQLS